MTSTAVPTKTIKTRPARRSPLLWIVIGGAAFAVGAVIAWSLLRPAGPDPRAGNVVEVAKFVSTPAFNDLPYKRQREYMSTLRRNADQVTAAHAAGQLNDHEYKVASLNVWLERKLDKMEDYFETKPGKEREQFLSEVVDKKLGGKARPAAGAAKPGVAGADTEEFEERTFLKERKNAWPDEIEAQWDEYDDALDARLAREKAKRADAAATAAGTGTPTE